MLIPPGSFIKSLSADEADIFLNAIIFITESNQHGHVGFVINHRFERPLNELEAYLEQPSIPLFEGGPVATDKLFFLHDAKGLVPDATGIIGEIAFGGDLDRALQLLNAGKIQPGHIKIFLGYCGWDDGELDNEIQEGSWEVIEMQPQELFIL